MLIHRRKVDFKMPGNTGTTQVWSRLYSVNLAAKLPDYILFFQAENIFICRIYIDNSVIYSILFFVIFQNENIHLQ